VLAATARSYSHPPRPRTCKLTTNEIVEWKKKLQIKKKNKKLKKIKNGKREFRIYLEIGAKE
jgi:hypothetical protein